MKELIEKTFCHAIPNTMPHSVLEMLFHSLRVGIKFGVDYLKIHDLQSLQEGCLKQLYKWKASDGGSMYL